MNPETPNRSESAPSADGGSAADDAATASHHPEVQAGAMIGRYKLLQQLGQGGMGVVWLAEQREPVLRRVALKIIKADLAGDQALARFEAERQALAMMEHPNIARVFDAGTVGEQEEGGRTTNENEGSSNDSSFSLRPYFVMELVKGIPFTRYCDQHQLTPQERLELFIPVCHAVQHAHQKGIIHRDLKPSNVLVGLYDGKPVPKIIDFGVAKAMQHKLTDKTLYTEVGQIVGTVEYMAPEQAELSNLDVDTRADIYSLGVMLYEILTGATPFTSAQLREAGVLEMLRLIREVEPSRPSTRLSQSARLATIAANRKVEPKRLSRLVQGDLDWIVMKCLEKDRGRRYETANQLGDELRRFLSDEPVLAGPPSVTYRAGKFLRRNKGSVIAAALVLLALVGGIIGTSIGLYVAEEARQAETEQRRVAQEREKQVTFANDNLAEANENLVALAKKESAASALAQEARAAEEKKGLLLKEEVAQREKALLAEAAAKAALEKQAGKLNVALTQSQRNLSNSYILVADNILTSNGPPEHARHYLNLIPPEERNWEWRYLNAKAQGGLFTMYGHTDWVEGVAFSRDGARIISGSHDETVRIWDARTGQTLRVLRGHKGHVQSVAFSSDGSRVASGSEDMTVRVWDASTGKELLVLAGHKGDVMGVAFSRDASRIASYAAEQTRIWDGTSGELLLTLGTKGFALKHGLYSGVALSSDGSRVAAAFKSSVSVWDARSGELQFRFQPAGPGNFMSRPNEPNKVDAVNVAMSPDGSRIAVGCHDRTVRVIDAANGKELLKLDMGGTQPNRAESVSFSGDGSRIACGTSEKVIHVFDARTGQRLLELKGHTHEVRSVDFSADGRHIVSGSMDGTVRLWDARKMHAPLELRGHQNTVFSAAFSGDGRRIVPAGDNSVRVWDAVNGLNMWILPHPEFVRSVAISGDGSRIFSTALARVQLAPLLTNMFVDKAAHVWNASGRPVRKFRLAAPKNPDEDLQAMAFSRDGSRLVFVRSVKTGKDYRELSHMGQVCDAGTGKVLVKLDGVEQAVACLALSADGRRIAGGSTFDRTVRIWDGESGKRLREIPWSRSKLIDGELEFVFKLSNPIQQVSISADGSRVAACYKENIHVWDAGSGEVLFELKGHTGYVAGLAFSRDGTRIFSGSYDKTVRVWDARNGQALIELRHGDITGHVAVSDDGRRLISCSTDKIARVWDAPSDMIELAHGSPVYGLAVSRDGRRIASGAGDGTVRIWDARKGLLLHELKGHADIVVHLAFSNDGSRLVSSSEDLLRIWDADNGMVLRDVPAPGRNSLSLAFSPDDSRLIANSMSLIQVFDCVSGKRLLAFGGGKRGVFFQKVWFEGSRIFARDSDGRELAFDMKTGELLDEAVVPPPELDPRVTRSDGKQFVHKSANSVLIVPEQSDEFEIGRRIWLTRPDTAWHRQKRQEFVKDNNAYAAALHQSWEQHALGVIYLEFGNLQQAQTHFIAALARMPAAPPITKD